MIVLTRVILTPITKRLHQNKEWLVLGSLVEGDHDLDTTEGLVVYLRHQ